MDDLISRQQAIDALDEIVTSVSVCLSYAESYGMRRTKERAMEILRQLPSAEPQERKTGRWISLDDFRGKYNEYGYKCSECGEQCDYKENYCPNCGARMEVDNERHD